MIQKISVYGLGKLGCTMLACMAHKGWEVVGVDIKEEPVNSINSGKSPIYEPGVDQFIKDNKERIRATTDPIQAALDTDVSFIIVPTPSKKDGSFTNQYVEAAVKSIGTALREKSSYHLVVITSTVMPGSTESMVELLEDTSGKICGEHFGVCYNPDFIALGKIIHDFLNPDMILIGESDKGAGDILSDIHARLIYNSPEIHRMSFHNAELAKIGLNSYCVLKICFANIIGEICENMPTGDADQVLNAIGSDNRVGRKYFKQGLAACGPCFPRDNRALKQLSKSIGVDNTFAPISDEINDYHKKTRIPNLILNILHEKSSNEISILGVAYKENINVIEESASIELIKQLSSKGIIVRVYDPACKEVAQKELNDYPWVIFTDSAKECLKGASICFIGTPWDEFKNMTAQDFIVPMNSNPVIFDSWGIYKGSEIEQSQNIDYRKIGKLSPDISNLTSLLQIE